MKFYLKRSFFLFFVISSLYQGNKFYEKRNEGFKISKISPTLSYHPDWEMKPFNSSDKLKIKEILNQPFYYLSKGGQTYVFQSEDQSYVIKLLKVKNLNLRLLHQWMLHFPFSSDKVFQIHQNRLRNYYALYFGYKAAFEMDKEHSGLLFLHFNPTFNEFGSMTLYDKIGTEYEIDLDQVVFILQKKGRILSSLLKNDLDENNLPEALNKLSKILEMYLERYKKGLFDQDHGMVHNTGFIEVEDSTTLFPIHIDLGKMTVNKEMKNKTYYKKDLSLILLKFDNWLQQHYPQYQELFIDFFHEKINELN